MRRKMRKLCLLIIGALLLVLTGPAVNSEAGINISVGISLPPLVFAAPPSVIVLPDTVGVYVVPDIDADLYFWNGYWWRLWDGRWYRSTYYDRGWNYYNRVPTFYFDVDPGWRGYYRNRNWYGHRWDYDVIPQRRLQSNWRNWDANRHWERQGTWGVRDYRPRPRNERLELRQQRQQQYQRNTDVQRTVQPRGHQSHQPQGQQQMQPRVRQQQPRGGTIMPQRGVTERSGRPQVQPTQKRGNTRPQDSPTVKGERKRVQPADKDATERNSGRSR